MSLLLPNVNIQESAKEDAKIRDESLKAIKDWLAKQPHLPDSWDDAAILTYLRWCKYSLERTKKKLDSYFTMKAALPEFFSNRNIKSEELQEVTKLLTISTLPTLTPDGNRVVVLRAKDNPPLNFINDISAKLVLMVADVRLLEDPPEALGEVLILDTGAFTAPHYMRLSPSFVKKFLVCMQEAYPERIKEFHVVNANPLVDRIYSWAKTLLKEKVRNRVHFHTCGFKSLHEFVPRDILPEEFGGTAGNLQVLHDEWIKKLEKYAPWFQKQENLKADESKRSGEPSSYDNLFGMDGSFKQLAVD